MDYCWVGDSWLVMLDSSFFCALDIHTRAYFSFFSEVPSCYWVVWLPLFMVIKMFDGFWQILYCTSDIHTRAYSPFLDEIVFGQWYENGWLVLVVYLTTSTSYIILGHIILSLMRFCLHGGITMDNRCCLFTSWPWHQILYWGIFPHFFRLLDSYQI